MICVMRVSVLIAGGAGGGADGGESSLVSYHPGSPWSVLLTHPSATLDRLLYHYTHTVR